MRLSGRMACIVILAAALVAPTPVGAEMIEEIIAWVNGDIITRSDYEAEEQSMVAEAYRRFAGEELDQQVKRIRTDLLLQMIDRKILVDHAERLYNMESMGDMFLESFREEQGITSEAEFLEIAQKDGMSVEAIRERLIEMWAPAQVVDFEVRNRIAIPDAETEKFYNENPDSFAVPGEATLLEIVLKVDSKTDREAQRVKAEQARQRVIDGEEFGIVAAELSQAPTRDNGGLLGTFKKGELAEQLEEVAFRIEPERVSDVIQTSYGFHILLVQARSEDHLRPLNEVQDGVRQFLEDRKFQEDLSRFVAKARSEAEWCVKPSFQDLLSVPAPSACDTP